jgi:hypothetical protein
MRFMILQAGVMPSQEVPSAMADYLRRPMNFV